MNYTLNMISLIKCRILIFTLHTHFYNYKFYNFYSIKEYFGLNESHNENGRRHPKPEPFKTKLKTNRRLNVCISVLMSILGILLWITMPFAILDSPCEIFKEKKMFTIYNIMKSLQRYMPMIDRLIIACGILLAAVSIDTIADAIKNTNINLSPWVEKGKYKIVKTPQIEVKIPERKRFSFKTTKLRMASQHDFYNYNF